MSLDNFADDVLPPLERLREDQTAFRITGSEGCMHTGSHLETTGRLRLVSS
jgi:hypothetical protein